MIDWIVPLLERSSASGFKRVWLRKDHEDELHEHNIGQDDEQRRKHDGTGCSASNAFSAAARAHSLKACDEADDEAEDSRFECGRKEIVERSAAKACFNEMTQGHGLAQALGQPSHKDAACVGGKGEEREHDDAGENARGGQEQVRVDRRGFDGVNLLRDFHGGQLRANACADASTDHEAGDDGAHLLNDGVDDGGRKKRLSAEASEA